MSRHQPTIVPAGDGWAGRCSCAQVGPTVKFHWQADNWVKTHMSIVRQAQAHIHGRNPTIEQARDYFALMANDPTNTDEHRAQWAMLALELSHRLGEYGPAMEQLALF